MGVRYAIKRADGCYYTEMRSIKTTPVHFKGQLIGHEETYRPLFDAPQPRFASMYATREDAEAFTHDPNYGGPESFAGCVVVEVPTPE